MKVIRSRLTAQGQISVPVSIRKRLGIGPSSVIEWEEKGGEIVVRKAADYTLEDLHTEIFPDGPPPRKSLRELKDGIRNYVREKHARR